MGLGIRTELAKVSSEGVRYIGDGFKMMFGKK